MYVVRCIKLEATQFVYPYTITDGRNMATLLQTRVNAIFDRLVHLNSNDFTVYSTDTIKNKETGDILTLDADTKCPIVVNISNPVTYSNRTTLIGYYYGTEAQFSNWISKSNLEIYFYPESGVFLKLTPEHDWVLFDSLNESIVLHMYRIDSEYATDIAFNVDLDKEYFHD